MRNDYEGRNRVLRQYFIGRDWDANEEAKLTRRLVLEGAPALEEYPFLYDHEWESSAGKGDLVFADGTGRFAIVEIKWMDPPFSGRNKGARRNDKRGEVVAQAAKYALAFLREEEAADEVAAMVFTNDHTQPGLRAIAVYRRAEHPLEVPFTPPPLVTHFPGLVRRLRQGDEQQ